MDIADVSVRLQELQDIVLFACKQYEKALSASYPPLSTGERGDATMKSCEDRMDAIKDFVSKIETLEAEDTFRVCREQLENAQRGSSEPREFDKLLEDVEHGRWPNYGAAEMYLTLALQSVGSAVPDKFTFHPENGARQEAAIWDRRKVLSFLRFWIGEQERKFPPESEDRTIAQIGLILEPKQPEQ